MDLADEHDRQEDVIQIIKKHSRDHRTVHFASGARTAWQTHPLGQTIHVTEGLGRARRRGGPVQLIRRGDRAFFEPNGRDWHDPAAIRLMSHLAMLEVHDAGTTATWGEHVSDEEYAVAPAADR